MLHNLGTPATLASDLHIGTVIQMALRYILLLLLFLPSLWASHLLEPQDYHTHREF